MKLDPLKLSSYNLRAKVTSILIDIQKGESLSNLLDKYISTVKDKDRALFHELTLGTLRHWHSLKTVTLPLLKKDLDNPTVETLIYLGIYQLVYTRIPAHASISETVEAVKQLGFSPLSGVVNAILRLVSRDLDNFKQALIESHGLPSWLYKRIKKDWPTHLPQLFRSLKETAPLTLRINQQKVSRNDYLTLLNDLNIHAKACELSEVGIQLLSPQIIPKLPGFNEGFFSVQDEHAQLCNQLLGDLKDKVVVDACAAPGGKTTHLVEQFQIKKLIAIDSNAARLNKIKDNLSRLDLYHKNTDFDIVHTDASTWQATEEIDFIILDAPCSATGVIRRHPDIRLLRKSSDIQQTVELQSRILKNLWQQIPNGGYLLYITCSILKAENEYQMESFFNEYPNAQEIGICSNWGIEQKYGKQLLPETAHGDGFYYCLIQKLD
ncbi:ribosomal RNA small subunit methyltransferase B [Acinetobacter nectaris CIP 110549]|uniref:16S rRNA (cytosine(967)-C(5))-methyltransferase n=1 Tax=Acinetobacter nectaris CIP 110549 TaxID=1392540 RepID=V2T274_9GAMM|nr:16S rRNA (cytosine(967)-C(5))-methyltransferase RsmB [Acinetobacter nectaris]ESK36548.1 ribosomal RNA small subunit methyltransferase B [Acinetobacter nectaris CIP 110549]